MVTTIKSDIAEFVQRYGYVTFPELTSKVEGCVGDQYIALPGYPNIWIWSGLSVAATDAIIELISEKIIFVHPASNATRLSYGALLNIPEATKPKEYKSPHWYVCVLHHSPAKGYSQVAVLDDEPTPIFREDRAGNRRRFYSEPAIATDTRAFEAQKNRHGGAATIRAAAILALLSSPALAQDADPRNQLVEGYMACLSGGGQVDLTQSMLTASQWTRRDDGEDGLVYFYPGAGQDTLVYMAEDGAFCHVESLSVDSATASEILASSLAPPEGAPFDYSKDDMGCTRLDFETGVTATITSGGNDPTCGSQTDSAVRFAFEE